MKYSVLLVYPDYMSSDYPETYFSSAEAETVQGAIDAVRRACMESNGVSCIENLDDLLVLLVIAGEHQDLKCEADEYQRDTRP